MRVIPFAAITSLAVMLSACDPDYQDTGNICAANETVSVRSTVPSFEIDTTLGDYKPYFADIYAAMQLADGEALQDDPTDPADPNYVDNPMTAVEKQALIDSILDIVNSYMGYTLNSVTGSIESANNPLDYIDSLVATTDPGLQIGLFQTAKDQVASGIKANDGYCSFRNYNIKFDKTDRSEELSVTPFGLYYEPFRGSLQQETIVSQIFNPDDEANKSVMTYGGVSFLDGSIFKANGFNEPDIRREALVSDESQSTSFLISDRYTNKLFEQFEDQVDHIGIVQYINTNTECEANEDTDGNITGYTCPNGATIRPVTKTACEGGANPNDENWTTIDETNRYQINSFDLGSNPRLQDLKRVAIETDYDTQEVRIYVSKYNRAIYDSDGTTLIIDPTSCERQVIQDEIQEMARLAGNDEAAIDALPLPEYVIAAYKARLADNDPNAIDAISPPITIEDPNYDPVNVYERDPDTGEYITDANNNVVFVETIEPTPIISFTGVTLTDRDPTP